MLRILVVDDEVIVLESAVQVITGAFEDVEVETARNAREALIKLEHFAPHIVFSDIKMPGMNGIEFIERARQRNAQVKIVIVSAYDRFEFAKEALALGVEDYILKPLSKRTLIGTIEALSHKIETESRQRMLELDRIEQYYQSAQLVESNFFNTIVLDRNMAKYAEHYRTFLELPLERGTILTVEFDRAPGSEQREDDPIYTSALLACLEHLKHHVRSTYPAVMSNAFINRALIYVEGMPSKEMAEDIVKRAEERYALPVRIGVGPVKEMEWIHSAYRESLLALRRSEDVICLAELDAVKPMSVSAFEALRSELHRDFRNRNKSYKAHLKNLENAYMRLISNSAAVEYAEAALVETLVLFRHYAGADVIQEGEHFLAELLRRSALEKMAYFEKCAETLFSVYCSVGGGNYNALTLGVIQKVESNYSEGVSLEALAEQLSVTPPYLSRVFKEDTGRTFKAYVTQRRMEAAKRHLEEDAMTINDVAEAVGYKDAGYFIRSFKRHTGMTPKRYQTVKRGKR